MRNVLRVVVGAVLLSIGIQEYGLLREAGARPTAVELAEIERGRVPERRHLRLGAHWRVLDELVYEWEAPEGEAESAASPVNRVWYPVVSSAHPYFDRMAARVEEYGSVEAIPDPAFPRLRSFHVLVRTERYPKVGAIPGPQWDRVEGVQGMLVGDVGSLSEDERSLLQAGFPRLDGDAVWILEEGRRPSSLAYCLGLMGSGAGLLAFALYRGVAKRRAKGLPDPPELVVFPEVAW